MTEIPPEVVDPAYDFLAARWDLDDDDRDGDREDLGVALALAFDAWARHTPDFLVGWDYWRTRAQRAEADRDRAIEALREIKAATVALDDLTAGKARRIAVIALHDLGVDPDA